jgi:hypothetical protein
MPYVNIRANYKSINLFRERINEKQEWAESYIICPGQDTLCRWM